MGKRTFFKVAFLLLAASSAPLASELFYSPYLSSTAQGADFAGAAAAATDITFQYSNPAAINYHYETELAFVPSVYWPRSRANVEGTTITGDPIEGVALGKSEGSFTPGFGLYGAHGVTDHLHLGVSITTPWIMNTKYGGDFIGRYYGLKSEIYSTNITPIVAVSWLNFLSFGVGPQFQYFSFDFTQALDFGSLAQQLGIEGALPGQQDGFESFSIGKWGWGLAMGFLAQPCPYIRLGVGYRSAIEYDFECVQPCYELGEIGAEVVAASGLYRRGYHSHVTLQTPAVFWAGLNYAHSSCLDLMAGMSFRDWDEGITLQSGVPGQEEVLLLPCLKSVLSYMLGARYRHPSTAFALRAGVGYDQEALTAEGSNPLFFADRNLHVSCGGEWCLPYGGKVAIAYTHNYMWEADIRQEEPTQARGTLTGKAKYDSDIISVQVVKSF